MKSNDFFRFNLKKSQLRWLISTLGYVEIPLIGMAGRDTVPTNAKTEFENAQTELEKANFISNVKGSGWQVHELLILLMQIIANPVTVYVLQYSDRSGASKRALAYPVPNFPLFLEEKGELEFTLYSASGSLLVQAMNFFNLPVVSPNMGDTISIGNPELVIPKAWISAQEVSHDAAGTGFPPEDVSALIKFVDQIDKICILSKLARNEDELRTATSTYLFWNNTNIWGGDSGQDHTVSCAPLVWTEARALLRLDSD